jgi:hypothetical protein
LVTAWIFLQFFCPVWIFLTAGKTMLRFCL